MTVRVDPREEGQREETPSGLGVLLPALRNGLQAWRQGRHFSRAVVSRLVLAFLLAVALWVYVTAQQNPVRTVTIANVPIVPLGLPSGYVISGPLGTASVQLQGLDSELHGVTASALQALVDVHGLTPGSPARQLPVDVKLPGDHNLTLLDYTPRKVPVSVDVTSSRSVQVIVVPTGQPPVGYQQTPGQPSVVDPPLVTVTGLSSVIARIRGATVEVNLSNATKDVQVSAVPVFVDATGQPVTPQPSQISPAVVKVLIPIKPQLAFNTLPVVADVTGTPAPGYWVSNITISPSYLTVFGDPRVFATLRTLVVNVSQEGITATQVVSTHVDLPHGVGLSPDQLVTVTLQAQPYQIETDLPLPVVVQGLPAGWTATAQPPTITVRVQGTVAALAQATGLQATADVAGLAAGQHSASPQLQLPAGVHEVSMTPALVAVTLAPPPKTGAALPRRRTTATACRQTTAQCAAQRAT